MEWETNYSADDKVAAFILRKFQDDGENAHLRACREASVERAVGSDGVYNCDTGCEYSRFEATVSCPHGEREADYEWGTFGELSRLIEAIHTGSPSWMLS